jgi:trimethylamine--corrinoid protein Co-methyltransferase
VERKKEMRAVLSFLDEGESKRLHDASLQILEKTGVRVDSDKVRDLLAQRGAQVEGTRVRLPGSLVEWALGKAPGEVVLAAREPSRDCVVPSLREPLQVTSGYSPFVLDPETGENRKSLGSDLRDFAVVADSLDEVSIFWPTVMPTEEPSEMDELCALAIALENTGKHVQCSCSSRETATWQIRLAGAVAGSVDDLRERPIFSVVVAPVSPLTFEERAADALVTLAEAGIPVAPMTMPLAGTTAPTTLAGVLALANAEELATLCILKCANPKAPMIYASDTPPSNLKTGKVNYDAPEYPLLASGCAQMARYYRMASMVSHGSTETSPYDLASFERGVLRVVISLMTRTDLSAWLGSYDNSLSGSLVQMIIDAEVFKNARGYLRGFDVNDDDLALRVIDAVGPGGHFLSQNHTLKNFRKALWTRELQDTFLLDSSSQASVTKRAKERLRQILATHKPPYISGDKVAEMQDILAEARKNLLPGCNEQG